MNEKQKPNDLTKKSTNEAKPIKRILKGEQTIHHDLFRLESSVTKKNIAYGEQPIWEPLEHKHFFHSINSDGKPQDRCAPSAGHFHYVTVEEKNGELIAKCSEPMSMKTYKKNGRMVREAVPYQNDSHTHSVTYLQSEEVKQRVFSEDALQAINLIKNREAQRLSNPAL